MSSCTPPCRDALSWIVRNHHDSIPWTDGKLKQIGGKYNISMYVHALGRYGVNVLFRTVLGSVVALIAELSFRASTLLFAVTAVAALAFKMIALAIARNKGWCKERTAFCLQAIQAVCDITLLGLIVGFGISNPVGIALVTLIVAYSLLRLAHTAYNHWHEILYDKPKPNNLPAVDPPTNDEVQVG